MGRWLRAICVVSVAMCSGCIAVSSKGNRFGGECDAVAVNGKVYLIDKKCGQAWEIDTSHARPLSERQSEKDNETH